MRQGSQYFPYLLLFSFLLLLISSSKLSDTSMMAKHGLIEERNDQVSLDKFEGIEHVDELMGLEKCGKEDEECLKRRIISEAHSDYIYTQQHKP